MKKTALISGASSGIGYELAKIHALKGDDLVIVARNKEKLEALKEEIQRDHQVQVCSLAKDLALPLAVEEVYNEVTQQGITVDYLINNAGFGDFGLFVKTRWEKEQRMIQLNIMTLTQMTKLFLPGMIKRGQGRIMNLASLASFQPGPGMAVYFATKAYVLHFSEALHYEVKKKGITVTALCPGPTASGFETAAAAEQNKLWNKNNPSAKKVAKYGYKAMMKGKAVAVHGTKNKLLATSGRFVPRSWLTAIVSMMEGVEKIIKQQ
jgi:short-subunit dehydrogenase